MYVHMIHHDGTEETRIMRTEPEHQPPAILILTDTGTVPAATADAVRMAAEAAAHGAAVLTIGLPAGGIAEVAGYIGHMVGPETYPGQATPEALAAAYAEHAIRAGSWDRWLLTLHATIGNRIRRNEAAAYVARREEAQ